MSVTVSGCFQATALGILLWGLPGCQRNELPEAPRATASPAAVSVAPTPESEPEPEPASSRSEPQFGTPPPPAVDPFGGSRSTPTPEAPATPGELPPLRDQGPIKRPVFSADPEGKQPTREFSGDVTEVFLNLDVEASRKTGALKSIWTSEVVPTIKSVDSLSLKPGAQHVTFSMARPGLAWPAGNIQVDLWLGNKSVARYAFSCAPASSQPLASPDGGAPAALPTPAPPADPGIGLTVLTAEPAGEQLQQDFATTVGTLYLRVDTHKLKVGVPVEVVWKAEQVEGVPPGHVITQDRIRATGVADEDTLFTLPPPPGKPFYPGEYRVDLMVARKTVWSCLFRLRPS